MISLFNISFGKTSGFSFVSVLLAVLALSLASVGVIVTAKSGISNQGNRDTVNKASVIFGGVNQYRSHHADAFPASLDYLVSNDGGAACALDNAPGSSTYLKLQGWCGPYLDIIFKEYLHEYSIDGWGTQFKWAPTGTLTSCGPDLTCGTSDDLTFKE